MDKNKNISKILDFWKPPQNAGAAIGFIATTFTFDPYFFEEECLSGFLNLDSDAEEDGPVYLIEREEKLSGLKCALIIVDQSHSKLKRNLRWDIIPIRYKNGIFHSKITLLCWAEHIRLIVGSCNITKRGYRQNREVYNVFDFTIGSESYIGCLDEILNYLEEIIVKDEFTDSNIKKRPIDLISFVRETVKKWNVIELNENRKEIHAYPVLIKPGSESFFDQIKRKWTDYSPYSPPSDFHVSSPFFDANSNPYKPSQKVWDFLKKKGSATINYYCIGEEVPTENKISLNAPISLLETIPKNRKEINVTFSYLKEFVEEDNKSIFRPVHFKNYWIEGESGWIIYIGGSSNFTWNGLGLGDKRNYEANILYIFNLNKNKKECNDILKLWEDGIDINEDKIKWSPKPQDEDNESETETILDPFFKNAVFLKKDELTIRFNFKTTNAPFNFRILTEDNEEIFNYSDWEIAKKPDNKEIVWNKINLPSGFNVLWDGIILPAWLPVNIQDYSILPTVDELKDLPLEVLTNILTSSKPLHIVLKGWFRKTRNSKKNGLIVNIDPHKKVDTRNFLIQRTRKYSIAINAIKKRLEQPAYTLETLNWRIYGPVGINAFKDALFKEAAAVDEKLFFLSEILLIISSVNPKKFGTSVEPAIIMNSLNEFFISKLKPDLEAFLNDCKNEQMKSYALRSYQKSLELISN